MAREFLDLSTRVLTIVNVVVGNLGEQLVQMEMMLPELAAVIARGNLDDTRPARRSESGAHRLLDRQPIESIHDDLEH